MRRSETQSLEPVDLMDDFQQLHERTFVVDLREFVTAIQVDDLSEESAFFHAARDQIACFAHNFPNGTTALGATRLRHDAKSAMHVAALHNRNKRGRLLGREFLFANSRLRSRFLCNIYNR